MRVFDCGRTTVDELDRACVARVMIARERGKGRERKKILQSPCKIMVEK